MKAVILSSLLLILSACSTVDKTMEGWSSRNNSKREYEVKTSWIRQTTTKDNLGFRKINRMTPVIVGGVIDSR